MSPRANAAAAVIRPSANIVMRRILIIVRTPTLRSMAWWGLRFRSRLRRLRRRFLGFLRRGADFRDHAVVVLDERVEVHLVGDARERDDVLVLHLLALA